MIGHRIAAIQPVTGELYAVVATPAEAWVVRVVALALVEDVRLTTEREIHPDTVPADYRDSAVEPVVIHDGALWIPSQLERLYDMTLELLPAGTIDVADDELEAARATAQQCAELRDQRGGIG